MSPARIDVKAGADGEVVVSLSGEFDMAVNEALTEALTGSAGADDVKRIVVDMSQTSFLDSSGIRALIDGHRAAHAHGVEYTVTGTTGIVRQVLEVTGVLAMLTGEPSDT